MTAYLQGIILLFFRYDMLKKKFIAKYKWSLEESRNQQHDERMLISHKIELKRVLQMDKMGLEGWNISPMRKG